VKTRPLELRGRIVARQTVGQRLPESERSVTIGRTTQTLTSRKPTRAVTRLLHPVRLPARGRVREWIVPDLPAGGRYGGLDSEKTPYRSVERRVGREGSS